MLGRAPIKARSDRTNPSVWRTGKPKTSRRTNAGTDAPICQDTPSGGLDDLLTSAEVGHDALVNLSREEAFQAADDVAFGPASGEASGDPTSRVVACAPIEASS